MKENNEFNQSIQEMCLNALESNDINTVIGVLNTIPHGALGPLFLTPNENGIAPIHMVARYCNHEVIKAVLDAVSNSKEEGLLEKVLNLEMNGHNMRSIAGAYNGAEEQNVITEYQKKLQDQQQGPQPQTKQIHGKYTEKEGDRGDKDRQRQ